MKEEEPYEVGDYKTLLALCWPVLESDQEAQTDPECYGMSPERNKKKIYIITASTSIKEN